MYIFVNFLECFLALFDLFFLNFGIIQMKTTFFAMEKSRKKYMKKFRKKMSSNEPIIPRRANLLTCKQWWRVCFLYGDQQKYYRQVYSKAAAQRLASSVEKQPNLSDIKKDEEKKRKERNKNCVLPSTTLSLSTRPLFPLKQTSSLRKSKRLLRLSKYQITSELGSTLTSTNCSKKKSTSAIASTAIDQISNDAKVTVLDDPFLCGFNEYSCGGSDNHHQTMYSNHSDSICDHAKRLFENYDYNFENNIDNNIAVNREGCNTDYVKSVGISSDISCFNNPNNDEITMRNDDNHHQNIIQEQYITNTVHFGEDDDSKNIQNYSNKSNGPENTTVNDWQITENDMKFLMNYSRNRQPVVTSDTVTTTIAGDSLSAVDGESVLNFSNADFIFNELEKSTTQLRNANFNGILLTQEKK